METRTGSARLDGGHDVLVVITVDTGRQRWPSTKTVATRYRRVFVNREAAFVAAQSNERNIAGGKSGIVTHVVLSVIGHSHCRSALMSFFEGQRDHVRAGEFLALGCRGSLCGVGRSFNEDRGLAFGRQSLRLKATRVAGLVRFSNAKKLAPAIGADS